MSRKTSLTGWSKDSGPVLNDYLIGFRAWIILKQLLSVNHFLDLCVLRDVRDLRDADTE